MDTGKKVQKDKKGREEDAKKTQEIECRFYANKYPAQDDLVMVNFFLVLLKKRKIFYLSK